MPMLRTPSSGIYGITPASDNTDDDSPAHNEDGHTLMQRASDIQFLRNLARRNGKLCRVSCTDTPGERTGYFSKPDVDGDPIATLVLNDPIAWNVDSLNLDWDVTRPTEVHEAIKASKFIKRIMSFYRPFKYKFAEVRSTRINQKYVKVGCALMHTLLQTAEGVKYLADNKLLRQIAECLAQCDPVSPSLRNISVN